MGVSLAMSISVVQGVEWILTPHPAAAATTSPSVPSVSGLSPWSLNIYNQVSYVSSGTPTLRAVATADAGTYQAQFELTPDPAFNDTTYSYTGTSGNTASGSTAVLTVPQANALPDGTHLRLRTRAYDGTNYGDWSGYTAYSVVVAKPSAPSLSCSALPANAWTASVPVGGAQCSISTTAGNGQGYAWGLDDYSASGRVWDTSGTGSGKPLTVTISPGTGWHTLYARTIDVAGNESVSTTAYNFGIGAGGAALLTPLGGEHAARRLALSATGSSDYTGVTYQYRFGATDTWKDVPAANVTNSSDGSAVSWPLAVSGGSSAALTWNITDTLASDGPVDVQAKFVKADGTTGYTQTSTVTVDRNAGTAPVDPVGPGKVNTLTGDFQLSGTDASFFGMTVSRTADSRQPDSGASRAGQAAIFGPQWSSGVHAELTGTDWVAVQQTSPSSVALVTEGGDRIGFTATASGGWQAEPGATDLTLTGSLTGSFTAKDTEGKTATFAKVDPSATTWAFSTSYLPTGNSTTTVVSEKVTVNGQAVARPKYIIAPTSAVSASTCAQTPSTAGCRVLEFDYATTTTASGSTLGDFAGQVQQIKLWSTYWGDTTATGKVVAAYHYDTSGMLRESWDPRLSTPLKTTYTYDSAGRVATLTPPGELPWTMTYGKVGSSAIAGDGMLLSVSRPTLQSGTASTTDGGSAVTSVVYNVPVSGSNAPYQLGSSDVQSWHQQTGPTDATAIFPADQVPTSNDGSTLAASSYGRATVRYIDASGRGVNTASPGGYIDSAQYDRFGNAIRKLSAENRSVALGLTDADKAVQRDLGIDPLSSSDRAELLEEYSSYSDDGVRQLEAFGPLHRVDLTSDFTSGNTVLMKAGTSVVARSWDVKEYDTNRPTDGSAVASNLLTITTSGLRVNGYDSILADKRVDETQYDWTKGLPTLQIQDSGGLAIQTGTGYDSRGRVISQQLPGSNGADAGARVTAYWQPTGTGACHGHPEWADLVCWVGPAGNITGGGSNPAQLSDSTTYYNLYGQPSEVDETSGSSYRTTNYTYDAVGRPTTTKVTGNLGQAVSDVTTTYSTTTGRATSTSSTAGGTISRSYDALGRQISYTDADGGTTSTSYDNLDRVVAVSDSLLTTTTYGYDSTAEPRGLPVNLTDSVAGTFTATYGPDGTVATEHLPGGYTLTQTPDTLGHVVNRTYTRDTDHKVMMSDSVTRSIHDQVTTHANSATLNSQKYVYDKAARLVETQDTAGGVCTDRAYTLDQRTNRTALTTTVGAAGAGCSTTGGTAVNHTFDSADRIVDSGYVYDGFGRTTAMPDGTTLAYYTNDQAYQQVSGSQRQTWQLDANQRRRSWIVESNASGTWAQTASKANHYASDTDDPRWITEDTTSGTVTRNVTDLTGVLAATTSKTGNTVLDFTNTHGDVNIQMPLDTTQPSTTLDTDEYGQPKASSGSARYSWLGGRQRSDETPNGLTLMGVRLYNPASGRFLSVDPVYGGNANAYDYVHADPIDKDDLDGRICWSCAGRWAMRHRGTIASVGATVGCVVPGVGWAACAGMQAAAYAVRAQQRAAEGGGWRRTWRSNAADGVFTAGTFGVSSAVRFARFGNLSGLIERGSVPSIFSRSAWSGYTVNHPVYTLATSLPGIVHGIGGYFRHFGW